MFVEATQAITSQELGHRLAQLRDAAGFTQAELARRITLSQAVLSRVESGERELSRDELKTVLETIGTSQAVDLFTALSREWNEIERPPLDHPDQDLLWEAEQVCRDLVSRQRDPHVRHAFGRRLAEYISAIKDSVALLLKRTYDIAFIGSKGIGKSTAICRIAGLEVHSPDNTPAMPVLESGGGGVTVCDVHLSTGHHYGLLIEPCSEEELRAHVTDFAKHIKGGAPLAQDETEDDGRGIAQEIERAIRNLAGFKVHRKRGTDGKTVRHDEAKEVASKIASVHEYVVEVLARMQLHRRDRRAIWYDSATGKPPLAWLKETFEQVNNGRHPDFTLPNRIEIIQPKPLLGDTDLSIRLIDTRGIDRLARRADLEWRLNEPHTIALFCSAFNGAPDAAVRCFLERARKAGIRRLERNAVLLVLPRPSEALAVKDEGGTCAQTIDEGYALKEESVKMALDSLGLSELRIGFFNALGDDPSRPRHLLLDVLQSVREDFRKQLREDIESARLLLANHEKEQVREVRRSAATMLQTWVAQNNTIPPLSGHVQDDLVSEIRDNSYASIVRATICHRGDWPNLDYGHHLGYGARLLAFKALHPKVDEFKSGAGMMAGNPEYTDAKDLIQQTQRVLESAFEELLHKIELKGRTAFKDALKNDPSLWVRCEKESGKGYVKRVADLNQQWFNDEDRPEIEREISDLVRREWTILLERLSSLLQIDEAEPAGS